MSEEHSADYDAAEDEAERRGCVPENLCWQECVEAALDDLTRVIPPGSSEECRHVYPDGTRCTLLDHSAPGLSEVHRNPDTAAAPEEPMTDVERADRLEAMLERMAGKAVDQADEVARLQRLVTYYEDKYNESWAAPPGATT